MPRRRLLLASQRARDVHRCAPGADGKGEEVAVKVLPLQLETAEDLKREIKVRRAMPHAPGRADHVDMPHAIHAHAACTVETAGATGRLLCHSPRRSCASASASTS